MKQPQHIRSLGMLATLREQEVERLNADMAGKQALRQRYQNNLARMHELADSCGPAHAGSHSPLQVMNRADYKLAVLHMADRHRQDLALHEADMAVAQTALRTATLRHEVIEQVRDKQLGALRQAQQRREQKQQDDLACQVWLRAQP